MRDTLEYLESMVEAGELDPEEAGFPSHPREYIPPPNWKPKRRWGKHCLDCGVMQSGPKIQGVTYPHGYMKNCPYCGGHNRYSKRKTYYDTIKWIKVNNVPLPFPKYFRVIKSKITAFKD